jgi:hypothetical protein
MTPVARLGLGLLSICCTTLPVPGQACAILTEEQAAARGRQIVEDFKTAALALKEEADLVFIGRLATLAFESDTAVLPNGGRQLLQKHQAVFERVNDIKGHYAAGQVLEFTTNKNRVTVSCNPPFWVFPKENGAGERYLVYARDGKILRTNHIPAETQAMGAYAEEAVIRGLQK